MTSVDNATPRTAVVTGAARGIGRGIAERLAEDGLDVVVADLPSMAEELSAVAAGIEKTGRRALAVHADVTSKEQTDALVAAAADRFGRIDVYVANAGIARVTPLLETDRKSVV